MDNQENISGAFDEEEYAEYIMKNADPSDYMICNGDSLICAMESNYLLNEYLGELNGKIREHKRVGCCTF